MSIVCMFQPCQPKVKVTAEGQEFEPLISYLKMFYLTFPLNNQRYGYEWLGVLCPIQQYFSRDKTMEG